jgi:hypothetical protein
MFRSTFWVQTFDVQLGDRFFSKHRKCLMDHEMKKEKSKLDSNEFNPIWIQHTGGGAESIA